MQSVTYLNETMLEQLDKDNAQLNETNPSNKQYIPILFEINTSKLAPSTAKEQQYLQDNATCLGDVNNNFINFANDLSKKGPATSSTNHFVTTNESADIYNASLASSAILIPPNYTASGLKDGGFQNITFLINNSTDITAPSNQLIIASNLNNNASFSNSSTSSTNSNNNNNSGQSTSFFDASSNKANNLQLQQQQQLQLQQQKLKMTKSKRTTQIANEIDEERTSQLVSEILKNIKEKTKELENLNQNLKTTPTPSGQLTTVTVTGLTNENSCGSISGSAGAGGGGGGKNASSTKLNTMFNSSNATSQTWVIDNIIRVKMMN